MGARGAVRWTATPGDDTIADPLSPTLRLAARVRIRGAGIEGKSDEVAQQLNEGFFVVGPEALRATCRSKDTPSCSVS